MTTEDPDIKSGFYSNLGDKKASYSEEDAIGPHWGDPWGCCMGLCDTPFSVAYREWFGYTKKEMVKQAQKARSNFYKRQKERIRRMRRAGLEVVDYECSLDDFMDSFDKEAKDAAKPALKAKREKRIADKHHLPSRLR